MAMDTEIQVRSGRSAAPRRKWTVSNGLLYAILTVGAVVSLFPFYWMLVSSFKTTGSIWNYPPEFYTLHPTFANYANVFIGTNYLRQFFNSLLVAVGYTFLSLFFSSLGGFAFAKYTFPGKSVLFYVLLGTMMVPFQVTLIPLFVVMAHLGWINTYQSVIVPFAANAFGVFLMRQNITAIPFELLDAARIDGCSEFTIYYRVVVPNIKPAFGALGVLSFLSSWNDFLWPLIVLQSDKMMTLPVAIALMQGLDFADYGKIMAASVVATAPIVVAFLLATEHFTSGALAGSLKG